MIPSIPAATPVTSAEPSPIKLTEPYLRVFHVNDSTDDQILFQAACRAGKVPFNWHVADSAEKGISYLKTLLEQSKDVPVCWPDLILLDIVMPSGSGLEVLKFIRATPQLKQLPVIIFTSALLTTRNFLEIVDLAKELYNLIRPANK